MSYLDFPRLCFRGLFQASPSTINNTPNNYDPANWNPQATELYWAPNGDGVFDLVQCKVSAVIPPPGSSCAPDTLTGQPVAAVYTNAAPKIVDLDPMQQNVSEVWGLMLQIGDPTGANVRGTFEPVAFNGIWQNSQGQHTPRSSASGSAVYQSSLTNLNWTVGDSDALRKLQACSPDRLSVRMVVNTHNNNPQGYLFDQTTFPLMTAAGVPQSVADQLQELSAFRQMANSTPGLIPTSSYVVFLLDRFLGEQVAKQWRDTILRITKQPYDTVMPTDFNHGRLTGAVGPAGADEPTFAVPVRTLARPNDSTCFFANAKLHPDENALTLDLGNSLPVELPGRPPWAEKLGTLSLAYKSPLGSGEHVTIAQIPYEDAGGLMTIRGGIVDLTGLTDDQVRAIGDSPLLLLGTSGPTPTVLLQENEEGLSLRADKFVFRMNPGVPTTDKYPRGETAQIDIHVRKFGRAEGVEGLTVKLQLLGEAAAINYTGGTMGTSGTKGIENLSVPQDAIVLQNAEATVNADGVARFNLKAKNPGNPRGHVDGQIYFLRYGLTKSVPGWIGDSNDLVSIHVYEQTVIENPTWENGIQTILSQFGRLYPVMARFDLADYDSVKNFHTIIRSVLELEMGQPLHMPATRDLSDSRRKLILDWMDAGMP